MADRDFLVPVRRDALRERAGPDSAFLPGVGAGLRLSAHAPSVTLHRNPHTAQRHKPRSALGAGVPAGTVKRAMGCYAVLIRVIRGFSFPNLGNNRAGDGRRGL